MNDVTSQVISERDKWNENYLAATFLENRDFFAKNGTRKPLTTILSSIYPQYRSRTAYLKSMIITPKLDVSKLKLSLEEISFVIDNLDLVSDDEEVFYYDKSEFFTKNFGSLYDLPKEVEKEHGDELYSLRLYGFLKGDTITSDLDIDFNKTQKQLYEDHILHGSTNVVGIGSTLCLISSLNLNQFSGNEFGFLTGSFFVGMGTLHDALKVYTFPTEIAYLYLQEKCQRADILIENLCKED